MDKIRIIGGVPLRGAVEISGAKNAALPLMTAALLTDEKLVLNRLPYLADIITLANLLATLGCELSLHTNRRDYQENRSLTLHAKRLLSVTAEYDLVRKMRASVLVLGPLLAREGKARVSLPGGCAIGPRPIDLHLKALEQMGAVIELKEGYMDAHVPGGRLKGAEIQFDKVSVGATENLLMAASLADGETILGNAAREPEVTDLARCLIAMGAKIEGLGSDRLKITGVSRLHGATHDVVADRIEAGTYAAAAAITNGDLELLGVSAELMQSVIEKFGESGVLFIPTERGLRVRRENGLMHGVDVMTQVFPGFPTDMQAQFMTLMAVADGASMITETIFENRFMHVPELARMGANVTVHGSSAMVRGVPALKGAQVMATDLRASSSLVLAALAAQGETVVNRVYHLDRGYERIEEKLAACGARIERIG
ncbi:MAG: UDP-N-acetylglucosamine 1-carboxyvinyltransferase [Alphaproteobacteria bacterium]|nr:UDP-N-acetylglucosamine 1-carboxyvinyltransferase [Alphaproteobacteria bacterium]